MLELTKIYDAVKFVFCKKITGAVQIRRSIQPLYNKALVLDFRSHVFLFEIKPSNVELKKLKPNMSISKF